MKTALHRLQARHGALINDMQAQGHAIPFLQPNDLTTVVSGADSEHNTSVINIGGLTLCPSYDISRVFVPRQNVGMQAAHAHRQRHIIGAYLENITGSRSRRRVVRTWNRRCICLISDCEGHNKTATSQEIITALQWP